VRGQSLVALTALRLALANAFVNFRSGVQSPPRAIANRLEFAHGLELSESRDGQPHSAGGVLRREKEELF
jgi:hypothetical protein